MCNVYPHSQNPQAVRKSKVVATVGPASWDVETLGELLSAGVNVFRLNFSHGDHKTHLRTIERIRQVLSLSSSPPPLCVCV